MPNYNYQQRLLELIPKEAHELKDHEPEEGLVEKPPSYVELRRWGPPFRPLDFQKEVIKGIQELTHEGPICGLLALPTGSGKTLTASRIVLDAIINSEISIQQLLWIAPQRELLFQASEALQSAWWSGSGPASLDVCIVERSVDYHPVSRPTCWLMTPIMAKNLSVKFQDQLAIAVFDEAHHAAAKVFGTTWGQFVHKAVHKPQLSLGLSATPMRREISERGKLQEMFNETLLMPRGLGDAPIKSLINLRVLSEPIFKQIEGVPVFARKRHAHDSRTQRSFVLDPDRWMSIIKCLTVYELDQCVVYALDRQHGKTLTRHLRLLGEKAEYVDGDTPLSLRVGIFERFRNKQTRILVNVALMIEGVDCPSAESVLLTYPVRSHLRLRQMIGRVLRGPAVGGKANCRVWGIEGSQQWLERILRGDDLRLSGWRIIKLS